MCGYYLPYYPGYRVTLAFREGARSRGHHHSLTVGTVVGSPFCWSVAELCEPLVSVVYKDPGQNFVA